jgi:phage shock protein PspC (stress-responsive transcriptional regulator)
MNKVISINLNGNSYQLDEDAYAALLAYLDRAQAALRDNPDKAEIMADLEQAIGEKCRRCLGPNKTVVLKAEVDQIILEMGPVVGAETTGERAGEARGSKDGAKADTDAPRKLYRIREGAMLAGVCTGLAAYFHTDVTIVRILFVVAMFLTSGIVIPVYFVMMLVIPEATTSDEHAAAHGMPFSAQDIVDRATKFAKGNQAWRRQWRRKQRQLRREWRTATDSDLRWRADDIPGALFAALMMPVFMVISLALLVVLWFAIHSVATTGAVAGWTIPAGMPFWVAVLILVMVYGILTSPLSAARHISYRAYGHYPMFAIWNGVMWMVVIGALLWFGSQHENEIRDFVQRLPDMWREIWTRFQQR